MDRMSPLRRHRGLMLVELLVALAMMGVLLLVVAPGMRYLIDSNRVLTEVHRLMTAINLVRSEAARRNRPVTMCPSAAAATGEPICAGTYADGWIIFADSDRNRRVDPGEPLIRVFDALPDGFTLTNRAGTRNATESITYLPDGTAGRNRTLLVCAPPGSRAESRSVVMNIVGRPRLAAGWGSCPGA